MSVDAVVGDGKVGKKLKEKEKGAGSSTNSRMPLGDRDGTRGLYLGMPNLVSLSSAIR
jgi:hypothetical protein